MQIIARQIKSILWMRIRIRIRIMIRIRSAIAGRARSMPEEVRRLECRQFIKIFGTRSSPLTNLLLLMLHFLLQTFGAEFADPRYTAILPRTGCSAIFLTRNVCNCERKCNM